MTTKKRTLKSKGVDPDEAPPLDRDWFQRAEIREGGKLIRRGRPKSAAPKRATSIRLDADALDHYRTTGPGWQSRINQALRKAAGLGKS